MSSTTIESVKLEFLDKKKYLIDAMSKREEIQCYLKSINETFKNLEDEKNNLELELDLFIEIKNNAINGGEDLTKINEDINEIKISICEYYERISNLIFLITQKETEIEEIDDQISYLEDKCSILQLQINDMI